MLLGKSCKRVHHINNGTLRLGSLTEYRNSENPEIADREEGVHRFKINLEGEVEVDAYLFDSLNSGASISGKPVRRFPGFTASHLIHIEQVGPYGDTVILKDTKIEVYRKALNCFIFCMSAVDDLAECSSLFSSYDDCWGIPVSNVEKFASKLASALLQTIKERQIAGDHVIPSNIDANKIVITVAFGKVMYAARDLHINSANKEVFAGVVQRMASMVFIKPPIPFSREKEFRFHFTIEYQKKIIEPLCNSIIIDSRELINFVI